MNQRMLLRTLSQPRPRYYVPKYRAMARAQVDASPKQSAGAVLATAFVFWAVYYFMRHFGQ
jgi:hypothetical protein